MTAAALAIAAAAVATLLLGLAAFSLGYQRGKAVGWLERHFAQVAKENAQRNKLGQFVSQARAIRDSDRWRKLRGMNGGAS